MELQFTKHTGWWCDGEVITEKSLWQVVIEGENREKQRRARITKREMAQQRAEEEAERLRAQRAREVAAKKRAQTRARAEMRKRGSEESKRARWRRQKAAQRARAAVALL
eukprot:2850000-Amphidinium_carterae.1